MALRTPIILECALQRTPKGYIRKIVIYPKKRLYVVGTSIEVKLDMAEPWNDAKSIPGHGHVAQWFPFLLVKYLVNRIQSVGITPDPRWPPTTYSM